VCVDGYHASKVTLPAWRVSLSRGRCVAMCGIFVSVEEGVVRGGERGACIFADDGAAGGSRADIDGYVSMLRRRGPDGIGAARVDPVGSSGPTTEIFGNGKAGEGSGLAEWLGERRQNGRTCVVLVGSLLQMRGREPSAQPLVGSDGSVLLFNGEIFGGMHVSEDSNDAEVLLSALTEAGGDVPRTMARVRGPWAFVLWEPREGRLWYGRDVMGRRSLLYRGGASSDPADPFQLVSCLPDDPGGTRAMDCENGIRSMWAEVPPGIFSRRVSGGAEGGSIVCTETYPWADPALRRILEPAQGGGVEGTSPRLEGTADGLLRVLDESVRRRVTTCSDGRCGVLFSGGLDSTVLAALADRHVAPGEPIELLNVCFDGGRSPDRSTAVSSVEELSRVGSPGRVWRLVEIEGDHLKDMVEMEPYIRQLLYPSNTIMDLNIGVALWLAAGGWGRFTDFIDGASHTAGTGSPARAESRALLCGMGADEQLGGYTRHRAVFERGGLPALEEELRADFLRLHSRNLGRDDRIIADRGREARFPYLDEDVVWYILGAVVPSLCDLTAPRGVGDKRILRDCARLLGLAKCAGFPKRAIQFGTRIAQHSNVHKFGSNRRANKANAGDVSLDRCDGPPPR